MDDVKLKEYTLDGTSIDVGWDEVVYDCFVFETKKIVVLKNEQFANKNKKL